MAEIKSTLELIMERTKNLTLSDEEKSDLHKKEVQGKIKGFIIKFMDGLIKLENLKNGITSFEEKDHEIVKEVVIKECIDKIDLKTDNKQIFDIIENVTDVDISSIQLLISDLLNELADARKIREQGLLKRIHKKGISGSAILPNLDADREWIHFEQDVHATFHEKCKDWYCS